MGTFNEFAAYNSQGPEAYSRAPGDAATGPAAPTGSPHAAASAGSSSSTAAQAGPQPLRDIVTGELLPPGSGSETTAAGDTPSSSSSSSAGAPPGSPAPGNRPVGGSASGKLGVQPPRDIRLEPVQQIASWLGSSSPPSGTPPRPQPEQGNGGSGGDAA